MAVAECDCTFYQFTQVTLQIIPLMKDEDLKKLGVDRLGDQVVLRNLCKNMQRKFAD